MVLAIDGRGPSNEMGHHLQPKKTKIALYYPCVLQQKIFYSPFIILTRQSTLVLKWMSRTGGNDKMRRQLQVKKTKLSLYQPFI